MQIDLLWLLIPFSVTIQYQSQGQSYSPPAYGYGSSYAPSYSYESYENSRTPRRAKLRRLESYTPQYSYGYGAAPQSDSWEAEYYYDACRVSLNTNLIRIIDFL